MEDVKIGRLGWVGHIIRMEEERILKKVLNGNFHTTRPVGRPRRQTCSEGMHYNCWG